MTKNAIIEVDSDKIREILKSWIDEADNDTIERIYNDNFDESINYDVDGEHFDVPYSEAQRVGIIE